MGSLCVCPRGVPGQPGPGPHGVCAQEEENDGRNVQAQCRGEETGQAAGRPTRQPALTSAQRGAPHMMRPPPHSDQLTHERGRYFHCLFYSLSLSSVKFKCVLFGNVWEFLVY